MLITSPAAVYFRPSGSPPATDASGEADYGHIDTFSRVIDGSDWRGTFPHLTIKREPGLVGAGSARQPR